MDWQFNFHVINSTWAQNLLQNATLMNGVLKERGLPQGVTTVLDRQVRFS